MEILVYPGDTLWKFSQWFHVPLPLIIDSNRTVHPASLQPGMKVNIPGYIARTYTVRQGDTFWSIAASQNVPVQELILMNREYDPYRLQVGTTIQVPIRVTWRLVTDVDEYDYDKLINDIRTLITVYPFLVNRSIGRSVMGKDIPEISIGSGLKQVHANGSFHANEWITTPLLMVFLNDYLLALTNQADLRGINMLNLYLSTRLSLVPMVNPDGVNLVLKGAPNEEPYRSNAIELNDGNENFTAWKANINGVDLNNQFPAKWEIEKERKPQKPGPRDYPGESPLSEPESIAMANLTRNSNFHRVLAFHSQGEEIYWGFEGLEPPESEIIVNEFARVSGYLPVRYLDSYAGYKDWFIQDFRRPGFTIEVGSGVNPLPIAQFPDIYEKNLGILLASLYM